MNRLSPAVAVLAAFIAAAPAAAQQTPPPLPPFSRSPMALDRHMDNIRHAQLAEYEAFLDQSLEQVPDQPHERIDLANRVSGLVQLGQCAEARALANEAGDRQMALRVRQICRNRRS